jgi:hypothetical protein
MLIFYSLVRQWSMVSAPEKIEAADRRERGGAGERQKGVTH